MARTFINERSRNSIIVLAGGSKKSKVGVAGDSAGGNISASVAHDVQGLAFEVAAVLILSRYVLLTYAWRKKIQSGL